MSKKFHEKFTTPTTVTEMSGAGVFLTTIVVGAVSLCGSFHLMERPFLRDLVFFIFAIFFTFYICYDHQITLFESLCTYFAHYFNLL